MFNKRVIALAMSIAVMSTASAPLNVMAEEVDSSTEVFVSTEEAVNDSHISKEEFQDGDFKYELEGNNAVINKYTGSATTLQIPGQLGGHTVTKINDWAFWDADTLTNITVPETVTTFGQYAFNNCDSLVEINYPENLSIIGKAAFASCTALKTAVIPKNVATVPESCFSGCSSLTGVTFKSDTGLKVIKDNAFNGCTAIVSLNIPDSVQVIERYAFSGCEILKSVKLPANLTKISEATFFYDSNLKKVFIPAGVTSIEQLAFSTSGNDEKFDIYYAGSEEQWKAVTIGDPNKRLNVAKMHYNSTLDDFGVSPDAGNVTRGDVTFTYANEIVFPGKKYSLSNFGEMFVAYGGTNYAVKGIKVDKKNKRIQITKLDGKNKKLQKSVKKLTKGKDGLEFKVTPFAVSDNSVVSAKVNKKNELKRVAVEINGKKYKCKKDEYAYDPTAKVITFKGSNLTGAYTIK
ncbi:Leucine rich repeat-containing protein [Lachnospiraceae bacterium]|nr:Leucine rich repeat-containing protein [Lachnospiraceae bacterium]